ncbi:MAG: N-acetylglucosamine-6-phosphate deacetylase [Chloroflexota bacterium]|nr:N-acetylglucosamine-6-phosphate deacetylase [Chloroflexota bacterium]
MRLGVSAAILNGELVDTDLEVWEGRISGVRSPAGGTGIAIPGLVDLQVNGYGGVDFMTATPEDHRQAARALLQTGVTAFLPTIVSAPVEDMIAAMERIAAALRAQVRGGTAGGGTAGGGEAEIAGIHAEGPFLSPARRGVHPVEALRDPDLELAERFISAGPLALMTLAPELPGALELIEVLVARGVVVSCGHTDATAEVAGQAFDRGARTVTHLFNGMRPMGHRDPGIVGAALSRVDVTIQIILDHVHLAPDIERLVWRAAPGRLALVTDDVPAAGLADGSYTLGPSAITVRDGVATGPAGQLSGGMSTLLESAARLQKLGAALAEAVSTVTEVPARLLGRDDLGRLTLGGPADLVVVDGDLSLRRVLKAGVQAG